MNGPWIFHQPNGQLQKKGTYKNGKWQGPFVGYYENGQMWSKGTYKNRKEEGPWLWYDRKSGRVVYSLGENLFPAAYRNGKRVGD
jgi:antitoxin component YwqK of YwqJK toxin-antitoxin module